MTDKNRLSDNLSASEFIANARQQRVGLLGPQAKAIPYTGVTGFMSAAEVREVFDDTHAVCNFWSPPDGGLQLAVGVLASWKTLTGQPAGQPNRYPKIENLRVILDEVVDPLGGCLRMIHYNSREPNLVAQIDRLCRLAGPNLDGFQLNIAWPDKDEVRSLAQDYPGLRFILQVSGKMYADLGRDPLLLADKLEKDYALHITDVLFDMSCSTGKPIDLAVAEKALEALYSRLGGAAVGGIGIGVAGGLDKNSVVKLGHFFNRWPDLSIDAEGRLRDEHDNLNVKAACGYVRAASNEIPSQ